MIFPSSEVRSFETVPLPPQDENMRRRVPNSTIIPKTVTIDNGLLRIPALIFSEFHTARWIWDFVVITALCWVTIFTPLQIAFPSQDCGAGTCPLTRLFANSVFIALEVIIDFIFWGDIFVCFRTSYHERGKEVFNARLIARNYLRSYFAIDLLSCIPGYPLAAVDLLLNPCSEDINGNFGGILQLIKFSKTSKLIKIARIVKVIRLGKVFKLLKKIEERFVMVRLTAIKIISILGATFIMAHLFGCIFISFATWDETLYYTNSWVFNSGLLESRSTCIDTYVTALYWSFTTMTTVGYGDVNPVSNVEKIFAMFAMMAGCIFYSFIIVSISNLMRPNLNEEVFQQHMQKIRAYTDERRVPAQLRREIQEYFRYYYKKKTALAEASILDMLTPQLKDRMRNFLVKGTLDSTSFFKELDNNAITLILSLLKPFKHPAGKILVAAGESGCEMFILVEGQVDVYSSKAEFLKTLHAVTSFGEIAMLGLEPTRTATIVARTDCELLCLSNKDMVGAFRPYPELIERIVQAARQNYERTIGPKKSDESKSTPAEPESPPTPKKSFPRRRVSLVFNTIKALKENPSIFKDKTPKVAPVDGNPASQLLQPLEALLNRKLQKFDRKLHKLQSAIEQVRQPERATRRRKYDR